MYFADLFAGIGGMRLGFERTGFECVLTSEIDTYALETYRQNFPSKEIHFFHNDVTTLEKKHFNSPSGTIDVLVAGFPCQPYSIAGLRKGLDDTRGGDIFLSLLRILGDVKPRAFLLENVKGIRSHENGATLNFMLEQLAACGYHIKLETLNSATHANVPQNRERVFMVGFRDKAQFDAFEFPGEIKLKKSIHSCLETGQVSQSFYYDKRFAATEVIEKEVQNKDTIYQWRRHYVRENKSNLCPTLTANMGSGGHNVPLVRDDYGVRKLTPRETANFQGFPKNFKLPAQANSHLYHQFGNSVTVPLIERIAKNISAVLQQ
jgi:DNA (cytosine-5)-methyltransferase 1